MRAVLRVMPLLLMLGSLPESVRVAPAPVPVPALTSTTAGGPRGPADGPVSVSVTPVNGTTVAQTNTSGNTANFTVTNTGFADDWFFLTCGTTSPVTSCSVTGSIFVPASGQGQVTVTYATGAVGQGFVTLTAQGFDFGGQATGKYTVTVSAAGVSVTPDGGTLTPNPDPWTGGHEVWFTVKNTGVASATYQLSCPTQGPVTCTALSLWSVTLAGGASQAVRASLTVDTAGMGTVTLHAAGGGVSDDGSFAIPVAAGYAVAVRHRPSSGWRLRNTAVVDTFLVKNTGKGAATFTLLPTCTGAAVQAGCTATPTSMTLEPGITRAVKVNYQTNGAGLSGTVTLKAQRSGGPEWDQAVQNVTTPGMQAPAVEVAAANPGLTLARGQCLTLALPGAGLNQCGDLVLSHALPPTRTLGTVRAPVLVYTSQTAYPDRIPVAADVRLVGGGRRPTVS